MKRGTVGPVLIALASCSDVTDETITNRLTGMGVLGELEAGKPERMRTGFELSNQTDVSPLVLDVRTYGNS